MTCENKLSALILMYPRLFSDMEPRSSSYVCADWYDLIDELCRCIDEELDESELKQFYVLQIKEKFGSLRFYFRSSRKSRLHIERMVETMYQRYDALHQSGSLLR